MPGTLVSFVLATVLVGLIYLVQFMALDYFVVRMRPYPDEVHHHNWALLLFPILPGVVLMIARRLFLLRLTAAQLVASVFAGILIGLPLIATVGIWFHFAIGGSL